MANRFASLWAALRAKPSEAEREPNEREMKGPTAGSDLRRTILFLFGIVIVGAGAFSVWAGSRNDSIWSPALGFGLLLLGSTSLVGGFLGLLFGIPKSVSDPALAAAAARLEEGNPSAASNGESASRSYAVNTNLEQISDWLTKIMVGVSLTQIDKISEQFQELATRAGDALTNNLQGPPDAAAPVAAAALMIYGLTAGFLAGYLLTRMFLPGAFVRADLASLQRRYKNLQAKQQVLQTKLADQQQETEEILWLAGEIHSDLYRYKDQGFRDAIKKSREILEKQENNPQFLVYLAAAHGQAWRWENENSKDSPEKTAALKAHREAALEAVKKALEHGPSWKPALQLIWNPHHPGKLAGGMKEEDDLEVFYDDDEFKKLLG